MIRLTGFGALALFAVILWQVSPLEPNALALQFAFTPKAFGAIIHSWPPEHLARYRAHLPVDYLLLLAYGAFGYIVASRTTLFDSLPLALQRSAKWCLPLAAVFDAAENTFHLWLTAAPRFGVPLLYLLSAGCASLKWLLLFSFGLLVVLAMAKSET